MQNNIRYSPRLVMLWRQSHLEAGCNPDHLPDPDAEPRIALYPESFVDRVGKLGAAKRYDFNFRGALYLDPVTWQNRQWVIGFAKGRFTARSYFQVTDRNARRRNWLLQRRHKRLGPYDFTFKSRGFVPKERPVRERDFFDDDYFRLMCASHFTLCPAGDAPWSMRFYECILSKSIPIIEKPQHSGRNALEYDIGYRYYLYGSQDIEYRPDWVEENFQKFLRYQTLTVAGTGRQTGALEDAQHVTAVRADALG